MDHLVGASGQFTLAKPIRVGIPDADLSSVRALALVGTLRQVAGGMATFDVEAWILHPDDVEPEHPPQLDQWAARVDGSTAAAHIQTSLIQAIVS